MQYLVYFYVKILVKFYHLGMWIINSVVLQGLWPCFCLV